MDQFADFAGAECAADATGDCATSGAAVAPVREAGLRAAHYFRRWLSNIDPKEEEGQEKAHGTHRGTHLIMLH